MMDVDISLPQYAVILGKLLDMGTCACHLMFGSLEYIGACLMPLRFARETSAINPIYGYPCESANW